MFSFNGGAVLILIFWWWWRVNCQQLVHIKVIKINTNSSPFSSLYQIFYRAYNYLVVITFSVHANTFWFFFYSELLAFQFVLKYNKSAFCILSATHWLNASHRVDFLCPFAGPSTPISLCVLTWKILIIFYVNCKRPRPKSCNRSNRNIFGLINWKMCWKLSGGKWKWEIAVEMGTGEADFVHR